MRSQRTKTSRRKRQRPAEKRATIRARLDQAGRLARPEPLTINLIPVMLPDGETLYTCSQEADAVKWATLLDVAIRSVADTIAATRPERLILWAGIGVLFVAATVSNGSHGERSGRKCH
jgi:hypothetical protein